MPVYIDEIGNIVASELVNIQPQVSGQIIERRFKDGDEVHPKQILFIIDPRMFDAKVAEADANVKLAETQLELAQSEFTRIRHAADVNAVSRDELETKKAAVDSAQAQIKVNQALLETARLNLSYATITSPIDGLAGSRNVDVGNIVKANETTLVTLRRLSPIYADFTITERDLPRVRDEMKAGTLVTRVKIPQMTGDGIEGKLSFLDTEVMEGAGRIRLRATLTNEDRTFWPGQFVDVRLVLHVIPKAVLVPYPCIQLGQQGTYVYVVDSEHHANMRPVKVGQRQGELVVIESGLSAGEEVIRAGQMSVTPGGPVAVVPPAGTATTATTAPTSGPSTQSSASAATSPKGSHP